MKFIKNFSMVTLFGMLLSGAILWSMDIHKTPPKKPPSLSQNKTIAGKVLSYDDSDNPDDDQSEDEQKTPPKKRKRLNEKENTTPNVLTVSKRQVEISPIKPKKDGGLGADIRHDSVYAMIAIKDGDTSHIPRQEDRIKFSEILGKNTQIKTNNLEEALLAVETALRKLIQKNDNLYYRTVYVGLAENASHRAQGHKNDLNKLMDNEDKNFNICRYHQNRKARFIASIWNQQLDVRMSSLVYDIPKEFLPTLEVLVGLQFNVLLKANTLLGNDEAWLTVRKYMKSSARQTALSQLGLLDLVEKLDDKTLMAIMNLP
jgi:hypothetical protein